MLPPSSVNKRACCGYNSQIETHANYSVPIEVSSSLIVTCGSREPSHLTPKFERHMFSLRLLSCSINGSGLLNLTHRSSAGNSVNTECVDQFISGSTDSHYKTPASEYGCSQTLGIRIQLSVPLTGRMFQLINWLYSENIPRLSLKSETCPLMAMFFTHTSARKIKKGKGDFILPLKFFRHH